MNKKWTLKKQPDTSQVKELAEQLNIHEKIANLLLQRGIETKEQTEDFFNPDLSKLHDPFAMCDMDKAVARIEKAIEGGEKILVYGDYDVDGTTAVALVYSHLRSFIPEDRIDYYVPERYKEGYGISVRGVDYAADNGFSLVIALDCGIKAVERINYAKSKGVDFIICDHHTPGEQLPSAIAVVDSKRSDCPYPDKNLSGCGVGFKLMQALNKRRGGDPTALYDYLDILAVSIASDIVPMVGENRILAYHGMKKLNTNPSVGLRSIIKVAKLDDKLKQQDITVSDVVFKIGPRINAAGRMKSGKEAVSLLVGTDQKDVQAISVGIDQANQERMELDRKTTEEAIKMIKNDPDYDKQSTTVLFNKEWMKGIVGIVASRLTEEYYRPTVVLTMSQGLASGSARSVEGYDLYSAIDSCSDLLENFGGHMYAAGLTMKEENVPEFKRRFEEYVARTITPEQTEPQIEIDEELDIQDITPSFWKQLRCFEPFGPGNPMPVFQTQPVYDRGNSCKIGKNMAHLRLELIGNKNSDTIWGVAFGKGSLYDRIRIKEEKQEQRVYAPPFKICYNIDENHFNGRTTLQLMIKEIDID
ncbi:MAG: single-stranded-DNA-specific exonuclease RecJ [Marinilabiliaceae bacterium]|nr:single-stranded-DNA-specific exonuclease RecJ [Marinilabiliaceae bacterium]